MTHLYTTAQLKIGNKIFKGTAISLVETKNDERYAITKIDQILNERNAIKHLILNIPEFKNWNK